MSQAGLGFPRARPKKKGKVKCGCGEQDVQVQYVSISQKLPGDAITSFGYAMNVEAHRQR
jgi:hypothetical protein